MVWFVVIVHERMRPETQEESTDPERDGRPRSMRDANHEQDHMQLRLLDGNRL